MLAFTNPKRKEQQHVKSERPAGKVILEMLDGYDGPVVTDAFKGYGRLRREASNVLALCWAHARRNFYQIRHNHEDCQEIRTLGFIGVLTFTAS